MAQSHIINKRIINKHDIEAHWNLAINFMPYKGELIIYDTDDTHSEPRLKIGDGKTLVNDLPFFGRKEKLTWGSFLEAPRDTDDVSWGEF